MAIKKCLIQKTTNDSGEGIRTITAVHAHIVDAVIGGKVIFNYRGPRFEGWIVNSIIGDDTKPATRMYGRGLFTVCSHHAERHRVIRDKYDIVSYQPLTFSGHYSVDTCRTLGASCSSVAGGLLPALAHF